MTCKRFFFFSGMLILLAQTSFAQLTVDNEELVEMLRADMIHVVVDDNNLMSGLMKEAVEKHWTATRYKFVTPNDFYGMRKDTIQHFLLIEKARFGRFEKIDETTPYRGIVEVESDHTDWALMLTEGNPKNTEWNKNNLKENSAFCKLIPTRAFQVDSMVALYVRGLHYHLNKLKPLLDDLAPDARPTEEAMAKATLPDGYDGSPFFVHFYSFDRSVAQKKGKFEPKEYVYLGEIIMAELDEDLAEMSIHTRKEGYLVYNYGADMTNGFMAIENLSTGETIFIDQWSKEEPGRNTFTRDGLLYSFAGFKDRMASSANDRRKDFSIKMEKAVELTKISSQTGEDLREVLKPTTEALSLKSDRQLGRFDKDFVVVMDGEDIVYRSTATTPLHQSFFQQSFDPFSDDARAKGKIYEFKVVLSAPQMQKRELFLNLDFGKFGDVNALLGSEKGMSIVLRRQENMEPFLDEWQLDQKSVGGVFSVKDPSVFHEVVLRTDFEFVGLYVNGDWVGQIELPGILPGAIFDFSFGLTNGASNLAEGVLEAVFREVTVKQLEVAD